MNKQQIMDNIYQIRRKMANNLPGSYSRLNAINDLSKLEEKIQSEI